MKYVDDVHIYLLYVYNTSGVVREEDALNSVGFLFQLMRSIEQVLK